MMFVPNWSLAKADRRIVASLTTTSVYVTEHEEALMNAMEKFVVGASRQ